MKEFKNILSKVKMGSQKNREGKVVVKKAGRPALPNKKYFQFRLDKNLHAQFAILAKDNHLSKSDALAQAIIKFMDNK